MYYQENLGYSLDDNIDFRRDRFRNEETLNIFTDGSYIRDRQGSELGGYAAIGIVMQDILNVTYRGWTSRDRISINLMELFAIKEALSIAFLYRNQYPNINIFSDSHYSIECIRSYIYKWTFDPQTNSYRKKNRDYAANIELIYEISMNMINLMQFVPNFNLYFMKGHINSMGNYREIMSACNKFRELNHIREKVDFNLIRYLSNNNDIADHFAKRGAKEIEYNCDMRCPIQFIPQDINQYVQKKIAERKN